MGRIGLGVLAVALMGWVCLGSTGEILQGFSFGAEVTGNRPLSSLRRVLTPKGTFVLVGDRGGWGVRSERSCCHRS